MFHAFALPTTDVPAQTASGANRVVIAQSRTVPHNLGHLQPIPLKIEQNRTGSNTLEEKHP